MIEHFAPDDGALAGRKRRDVRRRQITQTASQAPNDLSTEPNNFLASPTEPRNKQSLGNSRTDSIGRAIHQSMTDNPDSITKCGEPESRASNRNGVQAAQSVNANQQAMESLLNLNLKTAKNPLYKSSKGDRSMRPMLNDFPANHPQRAKVVPFKDDAKSDLGQSKSAGTALLKHKIQSHLKNRLLTPLKDQR